MVYAACNGGSYPEVLFDMTKRIDHQLKLVIWNNLSAHRFLRGKFLHAITLFCAQKRGALYFEHPHQGPLTDIGWEIYPKALYDLLTSLNERYTLPPIFITENGAAMADELKDGLVNDVDRVDYYNAHLNMVHNAVIDGVE